MTDTPQGAWMREYERRRAAVVYAASNHGKTIASIYATEGDRDTSRAALTANRAALDAYVRGLVDALERIAANGCEHIHDGDCWVEGYHSGSYTLDSDEWATRICDSCAARAALAAPSSAP